MTQLPVSVHFGLPDGWEPVPVEETAFAAVHSETAGIMLTGGLWPVAMPLRAVAGEAVAELRTTAEVDTLSGEEIGDDGFVQELRFTIDGETLVRSEVYLAMGRVEGRRAVVRAALTCTRGEFGAVAGDFRSFVASLGPDLQR
ncbi:hypothetical protein [Amycolatopsis sp.]|uniref:hypothetical protein n=1 Tax=Amycolatopsis sp. TaxID=37632 RepID=UPI002CCDED18|nr:hypothetical protein [Amycolatopsis sp.]HVV12609.1 hypothetical protein [Amycolatopsis sp.]